MNNHFLPKIIFICLTLSIQIWHVFAQDTTYLNKERKQVRKGEAYETMRIRTFSSKGVLEQNFNSAGLLTHEQNYLDTLEKVRHGLSKDWYDDGKLHSIITYNRNQFHGFLKTFWPNGTPRRVDLYKNDYFVSGTCYDSTGAVVEHYDYQTKPIFPGGEYELIMYIAKNTKYPVIAQQNGISGTVYIRFVVNKIGEVEKAEVMKKTDPLLEEEALRVVNSLPKWQPGTCDGNPVDTWFIIPVKFALAR